MRKLLFINGLIWLIASCASGSKPLPVLGFRQTNAAGDTIYHTIPDFSFVDQDSNIVTQSTVAGKIYVTDFFFTSCPTICPKMKAQMIRIHDEFLGNDSIVLLSHSIDSYYDSVSVLKDYAEKLGIQTAKWHLLTGDKDKIWGIASEYLVSVANDDQEPGGYIHGGHFILIDPQRRIRGYYDGTNGAEVTRLMKDIRILLHEQPS
ncbi:MAG: SCO family protein [Bacteroidia bacterium]